MPKVQVYLPEDLYERLKRRAGSINVSGVLQAALAEQLDDLDRLDALSDAIGDYEAEFGPLDPADIQSQEVADRRSARRPAQAVRDTRVA